MEAAKKKLKVDRNNALVRIPASMFKEIDKRKRRIPLIVTFNNSECNIVVDEERLYRAGL